MPLPQCSQGPATWTEGLGGGISGPLRAGAETLGARVAMAASLSLEPPPFAGVILGQACPLPVVPPDKVAFDKHGGGACCAGHSRLWSAESMFAFGGGSRGGFTWTFVGETQKEGS